VRLAQIFEQSGFTFSYLPGPKRIQDATAGLKASTAKDTKAHDENRLLPSWSFVSLVVETLAFDEPLLSTNLDPLSPLHLLREN
jgi:hypothetical protein